MRYAIYNIFIALYVLSPFIPLAVGKAKSIKFRVDWLSFSLATAFAVYNWLCEKVIDLSSINFGIRFGITAALIILLALALARKDEPGAAWVAKRGEKLAYFLKFCQAYAVIFWFRQETIFPLQRATLPNFGIGALNSYQGEPIWQEARTHLTESMVFAVIAFFIVLLPIFLKRKNPIEIISDVWTWVAGILAGLAQATCSVFGTGLAAFFWFKVNGLNEVVYTQYGAYVIYGLVLARYHYRQFGASSKLAVIGEFAARAALFISLLFTIQDWLTNIYVAVWSTIATGH
jgi:hypothetical protein